MVKVLVFPSQRLEPCPEHESSCTDEIHCALRARPTFQHKYCFKRYRLPPFSRSDQFFMDQLFVKAWNHGRQGRFEQQSRQKTRLCQSINSSLSFTRVKKPSLIPEAQKEMQHQLCNELKLKTRVLVDMAMAIISLPFTCFHLPLSEILQLAPQA